MSKEGEIRQEYTAKVQEMKSALDKQSQQLEILSFELEKVQKFGWIQNLSCYLAF